MIDTTSPTPLLDLIAQPGLEGVNHRFAGCGTDADALPVVAKVFDLDREPDIEQAKALLLLKSAQNAIRGIMLCGEGVHRPGTGEDGHKSVASSAIAAEADRLIHCIGTLEATLTPAAASRLSERNTVHLAALSTQGMAFAQATSASRGAPRNFSGPVPKEKITADLHLWWGMLLPLVDAVINAVADQGE